MSVMGDAFNKKIVWILPKVQFVNNAMSPPQTAIRSTPSNVSINTSSSKGERKKCVLLDIDKTEKIVATGRASSTNSEDVVHFERLGMDASIVWVESEKIGDAKVWRPNSEILCIAVAVGSTVAWPNDRLILI